MPSSRYQVIPYVLDLVTSLQPETILDIGIGYGKYGVLFREYLDIWKTSKPYSQRVLNLYGIEAFAAYKNPVWDVYDKVFIGNALKVAEELQTYPKFDLIFLGDVIEHFSKQDGLKLLESLNFHNIIIVTPLHVSVQEAVYGNSYEVHKSCWELKDFPQWLSINRTIINNQQVFYG